MNNCRKLCVKVVLLDKYRTFIKKATLGNGVVVAPASLCHCAVEEKKSKNKQSRETDVLMVDVFRRVQQNLARCNSQYLLRFCFFILCHHLAHYPCSQ